MLLSTRLYFGIFTLNRVDKEGTLRGSRLERKYVEEKAPMAMPRPAFSGNTTIDFEVQNLDKTYSF
jgi:hypothetical protein